MRKISVVGVQMLHEEGYREDNIQRAISMIKATPGHHLYVLPELACSGYGHRAFQQLDRLAEDRHGPSYQAFSQLAREQGCHICYSFPRRVEDRKPTICAAVVSPDGELVALYDKWHVCSYGECSEKRYFSNGNGMMAAFDIGQVRVGICICYDIRFPELTRNLAVAEGIHLLIHPGGWPRDEGFSTWHNFVVTRAIENSIYIMSPNRCGPHNGGTVFCPPFTDLQKHHPTALDQEEGVLTGEVDLDRLDQLREVFTLLTDRRPEQYQRHEIV